MQKLILIVGVDGLEVLQRPSGLEIEVRDYTYPDDSEAPKIADGDGDHYILVVL